MLDLVIRRLARDQWVRMHGTPRVTMLVGGAHGREIWNQWITLSGLAGTLVEARAGGDDGEIDEQIRGAVARAVREPAHPIAVLVSADAAGRWRAGRRDRVAAMVDEGWIAVPEPVEQVVEAVPEDVSGDVTDVVDAPERRSALDLEDNARSFEEPEGEGAVERELAMRRNEGTFADEGAGSLADEGEAEGARSFADEDDAEPGDGTPVRPLARGTPRFYLDARSVAEATLFEALEATPSTAGRFRLNESLSVRFGPTAAEVDLLSRKDRIAIEIDGMHHFADLVCYRRDRRKDLLLQTQGFVVVRLLAEDVVRDVRSAVTAINQVLAYRLREGGG
jgi:very-short-patch-repair endonuclease